MSHPSHVQFTKFYNRYTPKKVEDSPGSMFSDSRHDSFVATRTMAAPTQGRWDHMQQSIEIGRKVGLDLDKQHHRVAGDVHVGVAAVDLQRKHVFTALPGLTFNDQTWRRYASTSTQYQLEAQTLRSHSVPRCTGSPGRMASFKKISSRILREPRP